MSITDNPTSTSISVDAKDLDERITAFTQLVELHVRDCPAALTLTPAVLQLSTLRELSIHGARDVVVRVPELVAQLPLTSLRLDNVDVASLALPPTLQQVTLWSRDAVNDAQRLQQVLSSSSASVTSVKVIAEGDSRSQPVPGGWSVLPALRELALSSFQPGAPDLQGSQVESLEVRLATLDELKQLASSAPGLKSLEVWADTGDVPEEIGALTHLESLTLHAPVTSLPSSVTQLRNLKRLRLSKLPTRALPEAIGTLPALEQLDVGAQINTLPASLAQLSTLKRLSLRGALNKGALVSRWDDVTKLSPLPAVLSSLTALEELDLSHCGVFDAAPLRSLQRLRVLKMTWSAITTFDDIGALTSLQELDLEHADRVRDFSPLRHLQRLRTLNIGNTRPQSLDVLKELQQLKTLDIESINAKNIRAVFDIDVELKADDEVLERFKARQELRRLPAIDIIVAQLDSDDVDTVATALDQLASYVLMSSTRDSNAIESALAEPGAATIPPSAAHSDDDEEDEDEDEYEDEDEDEDNEEDEDEEEPAAPRRHGKVRWHLLESCIERHVEALPTRVLAKLFSALFQQMHEDHPTTSRIADEIVDRGDDDDQRALVAAFEKASTYYDTGHRMWEDTVQDHLIEQVFGQLRQPALVQLLKACSTGHFVDDGMIALWKPALSRASSDDVAALRASFEALAKHRATYGSAAELAAVWAMAPAGSLAATQLVDPVRVQLTAATQRKEHIATLTKLCSSTGTLHEGLKVLLAIEDEKELRSLANECLQRLQRHFTDHLCTGIAYRNEQDLIDLATLCRRTDDTHLLRELLLSIAAQGPQKGTQLMEQAGYARDTLSSLVRRAITTTIVTLEGRRRLKSTSPSSTELLSDDGVQALRTWATSLDGLDGSAARTAELQHAFERLGRYDIASVRVVIGLLAGSEAPAGGFELGRLANKLAGDVGQCVADPTEWPFFCVLARHLDKLAVSGPELERILAQLLGVTINSGDADATALVLQKVPDVVQWDTLAYNLACHFAVVGDKDGLLRWAKRSLELGKSPAQFAADHDFDAFRGDPAFVAVMASTS